MGIFYLKLSELRSVYDMDKKALTKLVVAGGVVAGAVVLLKKNKEKVQAWCEKAEKELSEWEERLEEEFDDAEFEEDDSLEEAEERVRYNRKKKYATLKRREPEHKDVEFDGVHEDATDASESVEDVTEEPVEKVEETLETDGVDHSVKAVPEEELVDEVTDKE